MRKSIAGQSFVEYLLLIGAIAGAVMLFANGSFKSALTNIFQKSADDVNVIANDAN